MSKNKNKLIIVLALIIFAVSIAFISVTALRIYAAPIPIECHVSELSSNPSSTIKINTKNLRVRKGASTKYKKIGNVYNGKTYSVYGKSNGWYKIKYNGKYGWVCGKYVVECNHTSANSTKTNNQSGGTSKYKLSSSDRLYIERTVMSEAGNQKYGKIKGAYGETYNGMCAIAQVIYDRAALKGAYKSTPIACAKQSGQFSHWFKGTPSRAVKNAVSAVFDYGYRVTKEPLYNFCTTSCNPSWASKKKLVIKIGAHKFYR